MSGYFPCNTIYIIVPTADITVQMVNSSKLSYTAGANTLRTSLDGNSTLFKIKREYLHADFESYNWYNHQDIMDIICGPDWEEAS